MHRLPGMQITTASPTPVRPTGCCTPFDPAPWHEREVVWRDRLFVREHVRSFLHVPLNFGSKVARAMEKIEAAGAAPSTPGLTISDETSLWGADIYLDASRPVPGAEMAKLSGTFLSKVYDGPFNEVRVWTEDMKRHVAAAGRTLEKLYFAYTTCPKCAKAYGHNYVVLLARVGDAPAETTA